MHKFCSKRRRFVIYLKINKKETMSFYLLQRQNDVVSPRRLPKNDFFPVRRSILQQFGGRGRGVDGRGRKRGSPTLQPLIASEISLDVGGSGDGR